MEYLKFDLFYHRKTLPEKDTIPSTIHSILPLWVDPGKIRVEVLSEGGSLRKYYRIWDDSHSAVIMDSSQLPVDFDAYLSIAGMLERSGIPAPRIEAALPEKKLALLEDLGDSTLYRLFKENETPKTLLPHYEKVVEYLARMQESEELSQVKREFDFQAIRWETEYFYKQFILRYCKMKPENEEKLFEEFDHLAERVSRIPRVFMHRDFQSQNIMVKEGRVVFLDFQGARRGLPQYDLASLLRDPYIRMPKEMEERLLRLYMERVKDAAWFNEKDFQEDYALAGIQRHSQALGAFSYLSLELGKKHFLPHIPPCFAYLKEELAEREESPCFRELVERVAL